MFTQATIEIRKGSERGVAAIVLLFALSIFSVLSLTVIRNPTLEAVLRTSDKPDLHVVLYAGGAWSSTVVGRLNLPTVWRDQSISDVSAEIRTPGMVGGDLRADVEPGWAYVVQLAGGLRACCDSGDDACRNIPWEQEIPHAQVTPTLERPLDTADTERELQFSLSSAEIAGNVALAPEAIVESPFLVKATKVQNGEEVPVPNAAAVSCRLETPKKTLAHGQLQLEAGTDSRGQVSRVSAGSVKLNYQAPKASR